MGASDLVVVGASAGGVEALVALLGALERPLDAPVVAVVHVAAVGGGALPTVLGRAGCMPAHHVVDGEVLLPGHVHVGPPDHHVVVGDGRARLSHPARENGHRPAVDPLFRSAAAGPGRVVGVLLSGMLDDGTAGLAAVRRAGGVAVVQDPDDALFPSMPASALRDVGADHVVAAGAMSALLAELVGTVPAPAPAQGAVVPPGVDPTAAEITAPDEDATSSAVPSPFGCPDCHGVLWDVEDADVLRFRCRTGHAWTGENLLAEQDRALEQALWTALRALEERADLARRLARRLRGQGGELSARRFDETAEDVARQADIVRSALAEHAALLRRRAEA